MAQVEKKSVNFGLRDVVVAKVISDSSEGITHGPVESFMLSSTLGQTTEVTVKSIDLDDQPRFVKTVEGATTLTLVGSNPAAKVLAEALGDIYSEEVGGVIGTTGVTPQYALGFKHGVELEDNSIEERYAWFMKGVFSRPDENYQTKSVDGDPELTTIVYTVEKTTATFDNGAGKKSEKGVTATASKLQDPKAFFETVITPATILALAKTSVGE